jgi:MerR family transcriptional regulator, light-induced transcriptional regulator
MPETESDYSIGVVERDTGIGRDTLRVWERRYGFPVPARNAKGERVYSEQQLRRLQRIRRLMGQGLRPGKLLPLADVELDKIEARLQADTPVALDETVKTIIDTVQSADAEQVQALLRQHYEKVGMHDFVITTAVPLLTAVGELWAAGKLQIFQEHFLSDQLIRFLNNEITRLQKDSRKPLVLLATLPGEEHTLGLLLTAAMLSSHNISTVSLGGEVPMNQIAKAADQFNADIIGLTFSGAYQYSSIRPHLVELRDMIPEGVDIWVGGEGVRRLRKLPAGVSKFSSLAELPV